MTRYALLTLVVLFAPALAGCATRPEAGGAGTSAPSVIGLAPGPFEMWNDTIDSFDGTRLAVTIHKPTGASSARPVPLILRMEGWGEFAAGGPVGLGRCAACPRVLPFLEAGFGVVSLSPRGWSESGGVSMGKGPEAEARDLLAVVDAAATWEWVALDAPGDPRMGATGFSAGGAREILSAFEETRLTGRSRLDALAVQNTWNDLSRAVPPQGVPKTLMLSLLMGSATGSNLAPRWQVWYEETMLTGEMPEDAIAEMHRLSAAWYVEQGLRLDIPVLFQQAPTDLHFPLNEALRSWSDALTPTAHAQSLLVAHRKGHDTAYAWQRSSTLPNNPCTASSDWRAEDYQTLWFRAKLAGEQFDFGVPIGLATHEGKCLRFDALPATTIWKDAAPATPTGTPVALGDGARVALKIADGPVTLAGLPRLNATVATIHPDARVFFALGVGPSPASLRIAGDQWMPWRGAGGTIQALELAGVVEVIPPGSTVFLVMSGWSEEFAAHGSRAPGVAVLSGVRVGLPVVEGMG